MKNIELTEDHKYKLLEMCKNLFKKEFHSITYDNMVSLKESHNYIHWSEFCITWLSHKIIFNPNNKLSACNHNHAGLLESTMSIFYGEKHAIHPIDYLYEEFKKLKI